MNTGKFLTLFLNNFSVPHHQHLLSKTVKNVGQCRLIKAIRNYSSAAYTTRYADFDYLQVTAPFDHVLHVELNRPDKRNAINRDMFREIALCFSEINVDQQCRAVVISGAGKLFCGGIDFMDMAETMSVAAGSDTGARDDVASRAKFTRQMIVLLQTAFTNIAKCSKPVIAAVHGPCIGAGMDLITSTDIRYATKDASFSIREVALGLAADLGTLQRLPKIVGNDSVVRELAYTARDISSDEAKQIGLLSNVYDNLESCLEGALDLAKLIASRSPVAVQGTKQALIYSRDHSEKDGLEFMQIWNMCMLQSEDFLSATTGLISKSEVEFSDF